jgi:hypothetical protein
VGEERVRVTQADGFVAGAGGGVNVGRHLISNIFFSTLTGDPCVRSYCNYYSRQYGRGCGK